MERCTKREELEKLVRNELEHSKEHVANMQRYEVIYHLSIFPIAFLESVPVYFATNKIAHYFLKSPKNDYLSDVVIPLGVIMAANLLCGKRMLNKTQEYLVKKFLRKTDEEVERRVNKMMANRSR